MSRTPQIVADPFRATEEAPPWFESQPDALPRTTVALARARAGLDPAAGLPLVSPERPSILAGPGARELCWREWYAPVETLAAGLLACGVGPGDRVLILSETRIEWFQADLAIAAAGAISVPVYPTLPAGQMGEIVADSGARVAFVSHPALLEELARTPDARDAIHTYVLFGDAAVPEVPGRILSLEDALQAGRAAPPETRAACARLLAGLSPDDPATLIYTSGTTGRMRGVLLTHRNLLASAVGSARRIEVTPDDVYLPLLPLSHVLERVVHLSMIWAGARLHYGEGLDRVEQDFRRVRPTIVVGVPRLYEKILRESRDTARRLGPRPNLIFRMAEHAAVRAGRSGPGALPRGLAGRIWNALVYRRVRAALGGRIRILISGGAPLGRREALFLNGAGLPLVEGYGLTETASVVTVGTLRSWRIGSVGRALPGTEIRLAEDGEILLRGPSVMAAYWNDAAGTAAALEAGWFRTGDLGRIDEDGFLFVTGRKKDLIVTAHGKKIAPQVVEARLLRSPLIREAIVVGDRRPFLIALIFPDLERLRARAELRLAEGPELAASLRAPSVRAILRAEIDRQSDGLAPYEVVRDFVLLPQTPTVKDGGMTPTNKIRRGEIERRYAGEITALYKGGSAQQAADPA